MQKRLIRRLLQHSFWLSVLLHLLFLIAVSVVIIFPPEEKKTPHHYVPSYVYKGAITPARQPSQVAQKNKPVKRMERPEQRVLKEMPTSKYGLHRQSILAASLTTLKQNQLKSLRPMQKEEEPILLIGDQNEMADPLIKLIGRSLSAHFNYPETEGRLGIRGRVVLELTLHPDGRFTDIRLVKSSENHNLDSAALYAANHAPAVPGADRFLEAPKRFVIGFVFYA